MKLKHFNESKGEHAVAFSEWLTDATYIPKEVKDQLEVAGAHLISGGMAFIPERFKDTGPHLETEWFKVGLPGPQVKFWNGLSFDGTKPQTGTIGSLAYDRVTKIDVGHMDQLVKAQYESLQALRAYVR